MQAIGFSSADQLRSLAAPTSSSAQPAPAPLIAERDSAVDMLFVRVNRRFVPLIKSAISWIEAAGNYVHIHAGDKRYTVRTPLTRLLADLADDHLIRVSKSAAVNLREVMYVDPWSRGELRVTLKSGPQITIGRKYAAELKRKALFLL